MKARIYLQSGAIVETHVVKIGVETHAGQLNEITWTKAEKGIRLPHINPADVSAITVGQ